MSRFSPQCPADFFATGDARRWLEAQMLPACLMRSRWFGGKARAPREFSITEFLHFSESTRIALVRVRYADGAEETYQLPLLCAPRESLAALLAEQPAALVGEVGGFCLVDAICDADFRAKLWRRMAQGDVPESRVLRVEQSNSSLLYGGRVFVKLFRKLESGINPDAEILRFLTERQHFAHVPPYVGALEHEGTLLALAIGAVPNRGDAWTFALGELAKFYESADAPEFLERAAQLGARTGELHVALAGDVNDPRFAPEPLEGADLRELHDAILGSWERVIPLGNFAEWTPLVRERALALVSRSIVATKTRTHGDYHLGQVLDTGTDFAIIDFEGEPSRPLAERRRKRSPLRDVAGMLRSFHYAAHAALGKFEGERAGLESRAETWAQRTGAAFLDAWLRATEGASFRPPTRADLDFLLAAFLLEKAIYEIAYELNNRPAWLPIPLNGLRRLLAGA